MTKIHKAYLKQYKMAIVSIFSFIVGCMVTINLAPIEKTCRLDNRDRGYDIMNNSKLKSPEVIVLILSAPKNAERRNVIRNTWLKLVDNIKETDEQNIKFKMKHHFVVGSLGLTVDEVLHLTAEQSQYSDMLILPMQDSYKNLTYKVNI